MIQQQYYTRERRGLFRSTEGYDSVAKSESLSDSFIKEYLHPFCFYSPPSKLVQSDGDISEYPKALLCAHLPEGEMVLGQTSYVGADFTGLRNTFFVHNLVISADDKLGYLSNPDSILLAENFCCGYDIEKGKLIEALDNIDYMITEYNPQDILSRLKIKANILLEMIDACIQSALSSRKVYIALDVEPNEISNAAISVLRVLLRLLPYEIRSRLGFITYIKEPENKKYINILFVDKNNLKANESRIKRDFVFDLSGSRVKGHFDAALGGSEYSVFTYERLRDGVGADVWQDFFHFTSVFCNGISLSPSVFDDINMLYMAKHDTEYRDSNILSIFEKMQVYLNDDTADYFEAVAVGELKRLLRSDRYLSNIIVVKGFVLLEQRGYNTAYNKYFLERFIIRNPIRGYEALEAAEGTPVYVPVVTILLDTEEKAQALETYIRHRLESISSVEDVLSEVLYWKNTDKRVLGYSFFCKHVYQRLAYLIRISDRGLVDRCCRVFAFLSSLDPEKEPEEIITHIRMATSVADRILLSEGWLMLMTQNEIEQIPEKFINRYKAHEMCMAIEHMQMFFKEKSLCKERLNRLTDSVRAQVIEKIRALTENSISPSVFHIVSELFDGNDEMLSYVYVNKRELLADFIIWCLDNNSLNSERDRAVISKYIEKNYNTAEFREKISGDDRTKPILKEVKFSRFTGFFKR